MMPNLVMRPCFAVGPGLWIIALVFLAACGGNNPPPSDTLVGTIEITVPKTQLNVGEAVQFSATVLNSNNQPIADMQITWTSSDSRVVEINATGLATGRNPGTAEITASAQGKTSNKVTVSVAIAVNEPEITLADVPFLSERWYLINYGQTIGSRLAGTPGADVRAPLAWSLTQGNPEVIVAVLDTGVAFNHPDLKDRMWTNPNEALNGIDSDGNGYVDDIRGWDFVDGDNDPQDVRVRNLGVAIAEIFHGTAVSSVIASLAPNVRIMPLRVAGSGISDEHLAEAARYARDHGARVVNLSVATLVPGFGMPKLRAAIEESSDVLFIASAGNSTNDADIIKPEPCTMPLPNVICVAATDEHDHLASFRPRGGSNQGDQTVHIAAPGANMLVAHPQVKDVYTEDFEQNPQDVWNATGTLGDNWTISTTAPRSGTHSLRYTRPEETLGDGQVQGSIRMNTPIELTDERGCWLEGWVRSDIDRGYLLSLEASTDGSFFYQRVGVNGFSLISATKPEWQRFMVPLTNEEKAGQLYIGFRFTESFGGATGALYLDDLKITCNSQVVGERDYGYAQGTSLSSPLVAAAAALAFSFRPEATVADVKAALILGGTPLGELHKKTRAPVRLDAYNTLLALDLLPLNLEPFVLREAEDFGVERSAVITVADSQRAVSAELLRDLFLPVNPSSLADIQRSVEEIRWWGKVITIRGSVEKVRSDPDWMNTYRIATGEVSDEVKAALEKHGVTQQRIGEAPLCPRSICPMAFDRYIASFEISPGGVTVDELFERMLGELPSGMVTDGPEGKRFKEINTFEYTDSTVRAGERKPQEGDLIHIDIAWPEPAGADVVIAKIDDANPNKKSFTVITVDNPRGGLGHPVWGARTFEVSQAGSTITVSTYGADSPGNPGVYTFGTPVQREGWSSFVQDLAKQAQNGSIDGATGRASTNQDLQLIRELP